ncbi:extensin-2-like isoform X1 [Lycium barbarum]|uniref:extensin-2-like isoform X1 n=1 Tax=Lycium barbarum TaxID=112863 RepID=UPI00293E3D25|nr:extensin-2-like isoform X1 [Lycium barbarum]
MASSDKNDRHRSNSLPGKSTIKSKRGKNTTKSQGKSTVSTSRASHSSIPPLHPPSHGPSSKSKDKSAVSTPSPSLSSIPPAHPPSHGPSSKSKEKSTVSTPSPSLSFIPQVHPPSQGTSSFSHSFYGTLPPLGYSLIPPPGYSPMPPQGYSVISPTAPFYNMPPPGCSSMPPSYMNPPGMHSAYLAAVKRCPSPETPSSEATRSASPRLSRLNVGSRNSEASPSRSSTPLQLMVQIFHHLES